MTTDQPLLVVIAGPTAAGKTEISIRLAQLFGSEIISADSRQFYRELKIGSAMPSESERACVPHHFVGHLSVRDPYNVSHFESDVMARLQQLFLRYSVIFMVGGSGLYIHAVCHGIDLLPDPDPAVRRTLKEILSAGGIGALQDEVKRVDPVYAAGADLANPARLIRALEIWRTTGSPYSSFRSMQPKPRPFRILKIGWTHPRETLYARIDQRVDRMMRDGLAEEAAGLLPFRTMTALNTVGYKELFDYFDGKMNLETAVDKIRVHTRRYAKRQLTWFRKEEGLEWFGPESGEDMISLIRRHLHSA